MSVEQKTMDKPAKRPRVKAELWKRFKIQAIERGVGPEAHLERVLEAHLAKAKGGAK